MAGPNGVPHGVLVYTTPPPANDTLVSTGPSAEPSSPAYADPPLSPADIVNSISADDIAAAAQGEGSNKSWIAGVVIGVVVLAALVVGVCVIARRRRRAATRFHVRLPRSFLLDGLNNTNTVYNNLPCTKRPISGLTFDARQPQELQSTEMSFRDADF